MVLRCALIAAVLGVALFALWHPARRPAIDSQAAPTAEPGFVANASGGRHRRGPRLPAGDQELVVYIAGAVKRPGLYRLRPGARDGDAVALAGGPTAAAQPGGVNLAQRAADGDEVYVPVIGETHQPRSSQRRSRRHAASPPPEGSTNVNEADAGELAAVPGIGRAVAARIVELRDREGNFTSLDELLDVAGMTQTRLDRARPYLRDP
jgi:competence ComEA-like helix-hairpin-helix protein